MRQRGFTLVEVMLALAILTIGLAMLIRSTSGSIQTSRKSYMIGVATDLTRAKMYDIEEELLREGFQELDVEDECDDFSDEGWKTIEYCYDVVKIEMPGLNTMQALQDGEGEGEGEDETGGAGGGLLGGGLSGEGTSATDAMGGALLSSQYEMFTQILEQSIRKVTLTVKWEIAGAEDDIVVTAYFTDPTAIRRVISGGGPGGGGPGGGGPGGGGPGGGGPGGGP